MQVFMEDIVKSKGKAGPDIVRKRKVVHSQLDIGEEGWVPWEKGARLEGSECLLEMVEAGTVPIACHKQGKVPHSTCRCIFRRP